MDWVQLIIMGVQWCKMAMMLRPAAFKQAQALAMFEGMNQWWDYDSMGADHISENMPLSAVFRSINHEEGYLNRSAYQPHETERWESFRHEWKRDCDKIFSEIFGEIYKEEPQWWEASMEEYYEERKVVPEYRLKQRERDIREHGYAVCKCSMCRPRYCGKGKDSHKARKSWGRHKVGA